MRKFRSIESVQKIKERKEAQVFFTEVTATVREQGSKIKIPIKDFLKGEY